MTGLNPLAAFTVSAIWYLECAPSSEDQELLSLCSPSPAFDSICQHIVSTLRRDSPVGVKYRENYTGEWFFDGIKSVVQTVMPWLDNASIIGKQAIKWIDTASTNNGYINPQSFVKGDVAKKVHLEKNPVRAKAIVPKSPGPAPSRAAFKPNAPLKSKPRKRNKFTVEQRLRHDELNRRRRIGKGRENPYRK